MLFAFEKDDAETGRPSGLLAIGLLRPAFYGRCFLARSPVIGFERVLCNLIGKKRSFLRRRLSLRDPRLYNLIRHSAI